MSVSSFGSVPLQKIHSFALSVFTTALYLPKQESEVPEAAEKATYFIGEGSNLLPLGDLSPLLSTRYLKGYSLIREDAEYVETEVAAGENWDAWVRYALSQGWYGIENLAAIPGSVGAAVVQNIGAYGVEIAPFVVGVYGWHKSLKNWQWIPAEHCQFAYRHSIFHEPAWRDRFLITRVRLRLRKYFAPVTDYSDVRAKMNPKFIHDPWYIYQLIRSIRTNKLPIRGSAGSFFKNPLLTPSQLNQLREKAPNIPAYETPEGLYKVPAAWLIDQAGLKGYKRNGAQVYPRQPLVLVNTGTATPEDIYQLALHVQSVVREKWGVLLEPEVRILPPAATGE
ncbi:MAG: UDP-N-acetylmuramate dehydrogenase [Bacteroidia bacterium]|nr:UDP-N-acetylmuramate dehydrogenase [Bacteroidia bacterium]MDW8236168.1 UDP-N-acetylmuramate dehydrogenase [Bacteroidia bacterium]